MEKRTFTEEKQSWDKKNGFVAKTYKMHVDVVHEFARACEQNGEAQRNVLTKLMKQYIDENTDEKEEGKKE